jgi:MOSC domain-containing protein YiiM
MQISLTRIDAVLAGRAVAYTRPGSASAIAKSPLEGPVSVGPEGIEGDEHGDPTVHGGADKAVHHYAFDHYGAWREELGETPLLGGPGAFGENLSTRGVTEDDVCLGDRLRAGMVLLEISQARQPCWKLNDRFNVPDMALRVQNSLRSGWYYRVLEPGVLAPGDELVLIERPYPNWPVRRLIELLYHRRLDKDWLREALTLPLPSSWHQSFEKRLSRGSVEDWASRLNGPSPACP